MVLAMNAKDCSPMEYADTRPIVYGEDAAQPSSAAQGDRRLSVWPLAGGFVLGLRGLAWFLAAGRFGS